jgi:thiamine biosynthesis lipoprotein
MTNKQYKTKRYQWLQIAFFLVIGLSTQLCSAQQKIHLEGVLGASLDLTIYGVEKKQSQVAVDKMSKEAERLESILSTWQHNSSISLLNRSGMLEQAPEEILAVIELCEQWHNNTKGMFSCRMGKLKQLWQQAQTDQIVPDRVEMRRIARNIQQLPWSTKKQQQNITLAENVQLDPAGLAKGYVIDLLMLELRSALPRATGIKLDIGGDMLFWGKPENSDKWSVGLLNGDHTVTDTNAALTILVPAVAVASSGHQHRYVEIERRKFSHILLPADGWPMDKAPYAVVVAPDVATADAVATTLSTQPAIKGIDWVNSLDGVEAAVTSAGIQLTSKGWHNYMLNNNRLANQPEKNLSIEYQIPHINEGKYHRPYLALWITDTRNKSVRHLMLLGESERWAKENTRWWRRVGRKIPGVLEAVARPTRLPGKYHLTWNYLNDQGQPVEPGKYWLHMEAAREGGGHDYQKVAIDTEIDWLEHTLPAKGELGTIAIRKGLISSLPLPLNNPIILVEVRP